MNTNQRKHNLTRNIWLHLLAMSMLMLLLAACSQEAPDATPAISPSANQADSGSWTEQLRADFQPQVQAISQNDAGLTVDYQPGYLESQETSLVNVVALMLAGAQHADQVQQVHVNLYDRANSDTPVVELSVDGNIARLFTQGTIEIEAFLEAVQGTDLRNPASRLSDQLGDLGFRAVQVDLAGDQLEVRFHQPEVDTGADVLRGWFQVFDLAMQAYPEAQDIRLISSGAAELQASLPAAALRAYQAGLLDAAHLILEIEVSDP
jgi:hypothetical protein